MKPSVVLAGSEVPTELMGLAELRRREFLREAAAEFRFALRRPPAQDPDPAAGPCSSPVGATPPARRPGLPAPVLTRKDRVDSSDWARYGGVPIEIRPRSVRGRRWCFVRSGIRGILAPDEHGRAVCYVICEPSTNYYKNMTGCRWMPVLIDQQHH
ncbi:MAG: hypothetical protein U0800_15365 [Isosphaeraceae bacterium]